MKTILFRSGISLLIAWVLGAPLTLAAEATPKPNWPAPWLAAWTDPPAEMRPLQIMHGVPADKAAPEVMATLRKMGLGGIVCNVPFADYLQSEPHWATLVKAVEACRQAGMLVWIYDEEGYPSASAGGLVLKANPAFESLALAYDPSQTDPFIIRPSYEHTHASNNYAASRRYPNLLDAAAMRCFIEKTHEAYWKHLEPYFGKTILATFTDEPSLMAVNIGQLPEDVRKKVRVVDPVDPNLKPLPSVPWAKDLPDRYRKRYGQDLLPLRRSLFTGQTDADRNVRRQFWALVADLVADHFFGQIQDWCHAHRIASSGHALWEEMPLHHVPLDGNTLKCLMRMDISGLDMLSSDPATVVHGGWMTATLPTSAALFNGGRRVMTEVSDFSQRMAGGSATLPQMQATAAWQAALGVTEFTLYYGYLTEMVNSVTDDPKKRTWQENQAYYNYVGRLNALLRDARPAPRALLYYPIYDLWAEYTPISQPLRLESQSPRAQQVTRSFLQLGARLTTTQVPFALTDHELLASAEINGRMLRIKGQSFTAVVLPAGVQLPEVPARIIDRFKAAGGLVVLDGVPTTAPVDLNPLTEAAGSNRLDPPSNRIVLGRFARDRREILLLVNVGSKPYNGTLSVALPAGWWQADPAAGLVKRAESAQPGTLTVSLPVHAAVFLTSPPVKSPKP